MNAKLLLTVDDLAEELSMNEQTIRRFMREKKLPFCRIGRRLYCPREQFDKFVESQMQAKEN